MMDPRQAVLDEIADLSRGDLEAVLAYYTDDVYFEDVTVPEPCRNKAEMRDFMAIFYRGFPDLHIEVRELRGRRGNTVMAEYDLIGTHTGEFVGHPADRAVVPDQGRVGLRARRRAVHAGDGLLRLGLAVRSARPASGSRLMVTFGISPECLCHDVRDNVRRVARPRGGRLHPHLGRRPHAPVAALLGPQRRDLGDADGVPGQHRAGGRGPDGDPADRDPPSAGRRCHRDRDPRAALSRAGSRWASGTGEAMNEKTTTGVWPPLRERIERLVEAIELIRRCWEEPDYFRHKGKYFDSFFRLYQQLEHRIPIICAAGGPKMAGNAGRLADGYVAVGVPTEVHRDVLIPAFEAGAAEAGRAAPDRASGPPGSARRTTRSEQGARRGARLRRPADPGGVLVHPGSARHRAAGPAGSGRGAGGGLLHRDVRRGDHRPVRGLHRGRLRPHHLGGHEPRSVRSSRRSAATRFCHTSRASTAQSRCAPTSPPAEV